MPSLCRFCLNRRFHVVHTLSRYDINYYRRRVSVTSHQILIHDVRCRRRVVLAGGTADREPRRQRRHGWSRVSHVCSPDPLERVANQIQPDEFLLAVSSLPRHFSPRTCSLVCHLLPHLARAWTCAPFFSSRPPNPPVCLPVFCTCKIFALIQIL